MLQLANCLVVVRIDYFAIVLVIALGLALYPRSYCMITFYVLVYVHGHAYILYENRGPNAGKGLYFTIGTELGSLNLSN